MSAPLDLTGKKFLTWEALRRVGTDKSGSVLWEVKCHVCGNTRTFTGSDFKRGKIHACLCQGPRTTRSPVKIGQNYGRLTVVQNAEKAGSGGASMYKCLCDCGREVVVYGYSLTSGNKKSCGCLRDDHREQLKQRMWVYNHSAENRRQSKRDHFMFERAVAEESVIGPGFKQVKKW